MLRNPANSGFTPAENPNYAVGSNPRQIAIADFDANGAADIAVTNESRPRCRCCSVSGRRNVRARADIARRRAPARRRRRRLTTATAGRPRGRQLRRQHGLDPAALGRSASSRPRRARRSSTSAGPVNVASARLRRQRHARHRGRDRQLAGRHPSRRRRLRARHGHADHCHGLRARRRRLQRRRPHRRRRHLDRRQPVDRPAEPVPAAAAAPAATDPDAHAADAAARQPAGQPRGQRAPGLRHACGSSVPGSNRFVDLKAGEQIPNGSSIDARNGRVTIVAAQSGTKLERADFFDGLFTVRAVQAPDDAHADRAARAARAEGARGTEEAQVAQAVGRRQGQVPHQGPLRGGDRPRHALARPGHLHDHEGHGAPRLGQRPRRGPQAHGDRAQGQVLHRPRAALERHRLRPPGRHLGMPA